MVEDQPDTPSRDQFSGREREIISELAQGYIVKDIARHLGLAVNTVKDYLKSIYAKAQVHSARELLLRLYGNPEFEVRRLRHVDLLTTLEEVLASKEGEHLVLALTHGSVRCLTATRAGVWRTATLRKRIMLYPLHARHKHISVQGEFLRKAIRSGTALHQPTPPRGRRVPGAQDAREMAALGLDEQVLGVRLILPQDVLSRPSKDGDGSGPTLLLVSRPLRHPFTEDEINTGRMLARVAELHSQRLQAGMPKNA